MIDRPKLTIDTHLSREQEKFMHEVLRPLLKQANERIIVLALTFLSARKINRSNWSQRERKLQLEKLVARDLAFKNQTLGMIIGVMNTVEFQTYLGSKRNYDKRIFGMVTERLISQPQLI